MQYVLPQDLKSFGLIPELIGRIPVLTYLEPLDRAALRSILTEPKNAIVRQYVKLFEMDGIALSFDDDALDYIVDQGGRIPSRRARPALDLRGGDDGQHVRAAEPARTRKRASPSRSTTPEARSTTRSSAGSRP